VFEEHCKWCHVVVVSFTFMLIPIIWYNSYYTYLEVQENLKINMNDGVMSVYTKSLRNRASFDWMIKKFRNFKINKKPKYIYL